jgi:hypothetical protein
MDLSREGYAPLDLALAHYVLEIAGWLESSSDEEIDPKMAENWLEQLAATIAAIDAPGRARLGEIADQLASQADTDPVWGGAEAGEALRQTAAMLLHDPRDIRPR